MTPYEHSLLSVRDFGGTIEDYLPIHEFIDSTKGHLADFRHRSILHNSWGMLLCEQVFGPITNNKISVREIARRHIMQDCSCVPTLKECIMSIEDKTYHNYNKPNKKDLEYLKTIYEK